MTYTRTLSLFIIQSFKVLYMHLVFTSLFNTAAALGLLLALGLSKRNDFASKFDFLFLVSSTIIHREPPPLPQRAMTSSTVSH